MHRDLYLSGRTVYMLGLLHLTLVIYILPINGNVYSFLMDPVTSPPHCSYIMHVYITEMESFIIHVLYYSNSTAGAGNDASAGVAIICPISSSTRVFSHIELMLRSSISANLRNVSNMALSKGFRAPLLIHSERRIVEF